MTNEKGVIRVAIDCKPGTTLEVRAHGTSRYFTAEILCGSERSYEVKLQRKVIAGCLIRNLENNVRTEKYSASAMIFNEIHTRFATIGDTTISSKEFNLERILPSITTYDLLTFQDTTVQQMYFSHLRGIVERDIPNDPNEWSQLTLPRNLSKENINNLLPILQFQIYVNTGAACGVQNAVAYNVEQKSFTMSTELKQRIIELQEQNKITANGIIGMEILRAINNTTVGTYMCAH